MAPQSRTPDTAVIRNLLEKGRRFTFFQAVRLLERVRPASVRVGYQGPASREGIRLRPSRDLSFPRTDLKSVDTEGDGERFRITSTFLGLYGSTSPLPTHYAQDILWQEPDSPTREFLDLFHHRLLSLFYRTWTKYLFYVRFEEGGTDEVSGYLLSLIGLASQSIRRDAPVPPLRLLRYAGLITQKPHGSAGLTAILSSWFGGLAVRIRQFEPRWVRLPLEKRNQLGRQAATFGLDLVLGARVYDLTGKFRVVVGPVGWRQFLRFLPDGPDFQVLTALTRLFVTDPLEFDVEVWLRGEEVPKLRLGGANPYRLGWTTWLPAEGMDDQPVVFKTGTLTIGAMKGRQRRAAS